MQFLIKKMKKSSATFILSLPVSFLLDLSYWLIIFLIVLYIITRMNLDINLHFSIQPLDNNKE